MHRQRKRCAGKRRKRADMTWMTAAGEIALRFLLSAVLAAGRILGDCTPFALGFVAASGAGIGGFAALIGAGVGCLMALPLAAALRYLAAAILIYAAAFAFFDLKIYASRLFMPLVAAGLDGMTSFVYLAEQGWTAQAVIGYFTEVLLVFCSARCFRVCVQPEADGMERAVSALFAAGCVVIALHQAALPFGLDLGAALAAAGVLWVGRRMGAFAGTAVALSLGLCVDLACGGGAVYTAVFGAGGLLCAGAGRSGKLWRSVTFLAGAAAVTLWSFGTTATFLPFWNALLGIFIWLCVPQKQLSALDALLPAPAPMPKAMPAMAVPKPEAPPQPGTLVGVEEAQAKLRRQAAAFHCLYEGLRGSLDGGETPFDSADLFRRASERACPGCAFRSACWSRELSATRTALQGAAEGLQRRGRADPVDIPVPFAARCSRINELVNAMNQEYAAFRTRQRYQRRLCENRRTLWRQYERMSGLLLESAEALEPETIPAAGASPRFKAVAGVAAGKREGQAVSGDAGGWFKDGRNGVWVVLCDGMGSGEEAAGDSRFAYRLVEQFLTAGVRPETALATVAGALALRWESEGSFTTIDLLRLDLVTGEGVVYKLGAGPTYLRRDGQLSRITSQSLPAGLQTGAADVSRFRLGAGDLAVLVSDGITDGTEDGWVREQIAAFSTGSPRDLALTLLNHDSPAADDRTAIVLRLEGRAV